MVKTVPDCRLSETGHVQSCFNCSQRKLSLLNDLNKMELETLELNKYQVSFKKSEVIYKRGIKPIGLMCLHAGKVKVLKTGSLGNQLIVGLKKSGDFIGFTDLMTDQHHSTTAVALSDTQVCIIPREDFQNVVERNPVLAMRIIKSFGKELNNSEQILVDNSQKHMRARMAEALIKVYNTYGEQRDHKFLDVQLKRAEWAELSNMTTANAIRVLSAFSQEKLIEVKKREICIANMKGLAQIAEG